MGHKYRMATYTSSRMQTNADWTLNINFGANAATWDIYGRVQSRKNSNNYVDLNANNLTWTDANNGVLQIYLTVNNCSHLGSTGNTAVVIEIIRTDPTPIRPIFRAHTKCWTGVAP